MAKKFVVLKIIDNASIIRRKIKNATQSRFKRGLVLERAGMRTAIKVKNLFRRRMYESDTYRALITPSFLLGELGLEDAKNKIDTIIEAWVKSLKLNFKFIKGSPGGIKGSFTIRMVRSNYWEVLHLREAKQRATSKRRKKKDWSLLYWLEWLLLRGDEEIVIGYDVKFRPGTGRTGLAIMYDTKGARSWSVPPGYTGTKNDNFVTHVLERMKDDIIKIMVRELKQSVRRA